MSTAAIAHAHRFIESWSPEAMYPSEIAWFLEHFEQSGSNILIECGRRDGLSTEAFARYFRNSNVHVISIDFDDHPVHAERARDRLRGLGAELISGDVHVELPKVLRRHAGRRVGVLQDGPKGWAGLATLLAAAVADNVALIAQHNLHEGHVTRTLFQRLSRHPSFIECSPERDRFAPLVAAEREVIRTRRPNRPIDHSSLGVMVTDPNQKTSILESFRLLTALYGPWNPARVVEAWAHEDFGYVPRLCKRVRFSFARFKAR